MGMLRSALLAGSQSTWLRERAMRSAVVRRSVSRFMPGERLQDALDAARGLAGQRIGAIFTQLGENVTDLAEADEVRTHYLDAFDQIARAGVDAQISIKPTQLGLDLDGERCADHVLALVQKAESVDNMLWIDMESTEYVDATLDLYRRARAASPRVGICLQAYLYRTSDDLESLLPLGAAIRLVKGAYDEPPSLAMPRKQDVDESFFRLAVRMLEPDARRPGALAGLATHDPQLIDRLQQHIREQQIPDAAYEFEMLYGIQRAIQRRLAQEGRRLRVLVSYGDYWFPWYMRRLAERPANVLFVLKNVFGN